MTSPALAPWRGDRAAGASRDVSPLMPRAHPAAVLAVIMAGRLPGLLAGYRVVVLVGLMGRWPPLERGVGADRLARWPAMGGRYTVTVIVAHAVVITWGYAVTAPEGVINE